MGFELRLLVVEDDDSQLTNWNSRVELHNAEPEVHGYSIRLGTAKSLQDTEELLNKDDFDAAIVDVRLETQEGAGPNDDGNKVLDLVLESELAVAALYTGESQLVKKPEWDSAVKVFTKGAGEGHGIDDVIGWIKSHVPMMKQIQSAQFDIKRQMAKLFSHSIWPRWSQWVDDNSDNDFVEKSLVRHLTSHVYATYLELGGQKVHPEEWYFVPPVRDGLRTGDLLKSDDSTIEVLITPRCDLARSGKNETFQLAECKDVSGEWAKLCAAVDEAREALDGGGEEQKKELEEELRKKEGKLRQFCQHKGNSSVYHFLPQMRMLDGAQQGPFLVQFDKIRSVKRNEEGIREKLEKQRIASITPEFLPSLVERLGAFFSRFGTPDYSHPDY